MSENHNSVMKPERILCSGLIFGIRALSRQYNEQDTMNNILIETKPKPADLSYPSPVQMPGIGDVVYLNSGSPPMTVLDTSENTPYVRCGWKDNYGESHQSAFPSACVTHQERASSSISG